MITLTTDFGDSEYVGAVKGVILSQNPGAQIIDITNSIPAFNIRRAAYALYTTYKYFPKGTVHMVVVDPGVGTERKGLILDSGGRFFVGPDNGVFSLIDADKIYEINVESVSSTFHGRDVFAPIAAKIDLGEPLESLGCEINVYEKIMKKEVLVSERITGEIYCIDTFGNIITSIRDVYLKENGVDFGDTINVRIGERDIKIPFVETYGKAGIGETLGLVNSAGYFEVSLREGSAAEKLDILGGESVEAWL